MGKPRPAVKSGGGPQDIAAVAPLPRHWRAIDRLSHRATLVNAAFTPIRHCFACIDPSGLLMRTVFAIAMTCAVMAASSAAQAENRVFIISNDAGYSVDHCLAAGAACGSTVATAFCRRREFRHAVSYRKVDRDDITGTVPIHPRVCRGGGCADYLAIECTR
jgi:hypothetical protein